MKNRLWMILAVVMAAVLVFAGCSAKNAEGTGNYYYDAEMPNSENAKSDQYSGSDDAGFVLATDEGRKIVWTATIGMETTEWSATMAGLKTLFDAHGVQVMSANEQGGNYYEVSGATRRSARSVSYVLRVPSANFQAFMEGFSDVTGSVTKSTKSRADMTKVYDENALTIDLLQTEYDDLKELLKEAKDLTEIMLIRDRMTEVMTEIKKLNQANNDIDYNVDYSRVTLSLREVVVYSDPEKQENWFTRFGNGFVEGVTGFGTFMGEVIIWIFSHIFYLLLIAVAIWLPIFLIRRANRKRRAKREAAKAAQAQQAAAPQTPVPQAPVQTPEQKA